MTDIDRIKGLLSEFYNAEEQEMWWEIPQDRFEGKSAKEMLIDGRESEVLNSLKQLDDSVYL